MSRVRCKAPSCTDDALMWALSSEGMGINRIADKFDLPASQVRIRIRREDRRIGGRKKKH